MSAQEQEGCPYCCADEVRDDPVDEPRIVGTLPRESPPWKKLSRQRWSIERLFRSVKHSQNLDQHCFGGFRKVTLHAEVTHSATALARLKAEDEKRMRVNVV